MAKSTTALSPWEKKRQDLLAEMTEPLREVALEFDKKLAQLAKGTIMIRYDMGARVAVVMKETSTYGANAAEQLAAYLGLNDTTTLYNMQNFSLEFTREEMEGEIAKPMANGKPLEYGHFTALMKLSSKQEQGKLLKRVRAECLSVNSLDELIRAQYATKNERKGGRKPKTPASPLAGLQKGFSQAQQLANYLDVLDDKVLGELEEMPADKIETKHLERLEQFENQALDTEQKLDAIQKKLVPVKNRLRTILEKAGGNGEADGESDSVPVHKPKKKAKKGKAGKAEADKAEAGKAEAKKSSGKKPEKKVAKKKARRRPAPV